ncbi:MAG: hypothetical protein QM765_26730 [Myxococcales bacterium]
MRTLVSIVAIALGCSGCLCPSFPSQPEYDCEQQASGASGCAPMDPENYPAGTTYPVDCRVTTTRKQPADVIVGCPNGTPLTCSCRGMSDVEGSSFSWSCPM